MSPIVLMTKMDKNGFTLLEVLIALALMSILLIALYGSYFAVMKARGSVEKGLDNYIEVGLFFDRFNRKVRSAYFQPTNPTTFFKGERWGTTSDLTFTAFVYPVLKKNLNTSDLIASRYFLGDAEEGKTLYMEIWNPYVEERFKVGILENIEGFEVDYFNGNDWTKAWDASLEGGLPKAVRLILTTKEGEEISSIARPKIN